MENNHVASYCEFDKTLLGGWYERLAGATRKLVVVTGATNKNIVTTS